jgi:hypothetical protein
MQTLTINAKQSNSGSIHDIAATHDRIIKFPTAAKFAVICASYYGGKGYTTHKTAAAAIRASQLLGEYSHKIVDIDRNIYSVKSDYWDSSLVSLGEKIDGHSVTQKPINKVRASESRKIAGGGKRIGGILPKDAADKLHSLISSGYAPSIMAAIVKALLHA